MNATSNDLLQRARELHRRTIVIDTHCDTTQRLLDPAWDFTKRHDDGHVDLPRLHEGGIRALILAVWAPGPLPKGEGLAAARQQIKRIHETIRRHEDQLALARTVADVRTAAREDRLAILIGIEGGYLIEESLDALREFHEQGAIYLTLTHAFHISWADSSGVHEPLQPLHGGLTDFGREVVAELNRLGMMVDVSHVSVDTLRDVLEVSKAPVIASHSSCYAVSPHIRNLTDEQMRAIAKSGGTVQINFAANFLDPAFPKIAPNALKEWMARGGPSGGPFTDHVTPLNILADHVMHALSVVGADHVGLGSDFDGVPQVPEGMESCARLSHLTAELLRRGVSEDDLMKILGDNALRVMEACRRVSEGLRRRPFDTDWPQLSDHGLA